MSQSKAIETIERLEKSSAYYMKKWQEADIALTKLRRSIQDNCEHEWRVDTEECDPHKTHWVCRICRRPRG